MAAIRMLEKVNPKKKTGLDQGHIADEKKNSHSQKKGEYNGHAPGGGGGLVVGRSLVGGIQYPGMSEDEPGHRN
jgi:hypothetical protein